MRIYLALAFGFLVLTISAQDCPFGTSMETLYGNAVKTTMLNGGDMWWDFKRARYAIPYNAGDSIQKNVLFTGAIWMGGIDKSGQLRLAAQTFREVYEEQVNDYWPGPLMKDGSASIENCLEFDTHYKVTREEIELQKSLAANHEVLNGGSIPIYKIPFSIRNWPAAGNPYFNGATGLSISLDSNTRLAPFVNFDGEPGYDPSKGDYPDIFESEQGIFWVLNDQLHEHTASKLRSDTLSQGGKPLGIEIRKMAYAYNNPGVLDSTTFYHFEYEAKKMDLDSFYLTLFIDPDVGTYQDDFVGCDTVRNLGIGYNGRSVDLGKYGYGIDPPFVGVDFLKIKAPRQQPDLGMTSFMFYNNDFSSIGKPEKPSDFYGYMQGLWKDSTYPTYPVGHAKADQRTNYMYYSEPNDTVAGAWSECKDGNTPWDRRFIMSSGPYSLKKGETISLDFAVIFARCSDYERCPSFDCIQSASDEVQAFFDQEIATSVEEIHRKALDWNISPNPAFSYFLVEIDEPNAKTLRITDLTGKLIYTSRVDGREVIKINTKDFQAGVYLVQLTSDQGQSNRKVIIGN